MEIRYCSVVQGENNYEELNEFREATDFFMDGNDVKICTEHANRVEETHFVIN